MINKFVSTCFNTTKNVATKTTLYTIGLGARVGKPVIKNSAKLTGTALITITGLNHAIEACSSAKSFYQHSLGKPTITTGGEIFHYSANTKIKKTIVHIDNFERDKTPEEKKKTRAKDLKNGFSQLKAFGLNLAIADFIFNRIMGWDPVSLATDVIETGAKTAKDTLAKHSFSDYTSMAMKWAKENKEMPQQALKIATETLEHSPALTMGLLAVGSAYSAISDIWNFHTTKKTITTEIEVNSKSNTEFKVNTNSNCYTSKTEGNCTSFKSTVGLGNYKTTNPGSTLIKTQFIETRKNCCHLIADISKLALKIGFSAALAYGAYVAPTLSDLKN